MECRPAIAAPLNIAEKSSATPVAEPSSALSPLLASSSLDPPPTFFDLDFSIAQRKGIHSCWENN